MPLPTQRKAAAPPSTQGTQGLVEGGRRCRRRDRTSQEVSESSALDREVGVVAMDEQFGIEGRGVGHGASSGVVVQRLTGVRSAGVPQCRRVALRLPSAAGSTRRIGMTRLGSVPTPIGGREVPAIALLRVRSVS